MRRHQISGRSGTPVNLIVHSMRSLNAQLKRGRPFFADIVRDGVVLYEAPGHPLQRPVRLSQADARVEARSHRDHWLPLARHALRLAIVSVGDGVPRDAAFLLHQAVERLYHCTLLVLTLYSPKSHKLNFLRSQAERVAPELISAWPREDRAALRRFELLRRAYVDARYSPHFAVTGEEMDWLIDRISLLEQSVTEVCDKRLCV